VTAYEGILEALVRRVSTGQGDHVEVSLFEAIADWMSVPLLHASYARAPERIGLRHPSIAPYGVYTCSEGGQILLSVQNEPEWASLCGGVLRRPDLISDPHYRDNSSRVENREVLDALIQQRLSTLSIEEACGSLDAADIAYGLVNELDAVLRHPSLRTIEVQTPAGVVSVPAPAARHLSVVANLGAVPALNEHGAAIRREFSRLSESASPA
jgi:crotonobetainyl-CoA:carnitine CoA-transferase CaiB-like acyl-CoA transferase